MKYEEYVARCQALAKIGLKFSKDPYAIENYEELEKISGQMMSELINDEVINIYDRDIYPTPSSSVRVIVFNEHNELLMVQERQDFGYAVPGGWCEVFETLREAAIKEVRQETGFDVEIVRLLAIFQRERYKDYPSVVSEQVHYFLAKIVGGGIKANHEIMNVKFFSLDEICDLSRKNTNKELDTALKVAIENLEVYCD